MDCAGRAQRRRRFGWPPVGCGIADLVSAIPRIQSGVALRFPPHSKRWRGIQVLASDDVRAEKAVRAPFGAVVQSTLLAGQLKTCSVSGRLNAVDRLERSNTLVRHAGITAALLFAFGIGHVAELPRPGEAIDAGDSYRLKDGSRVALQRVVNEVALENSG